MTEKDLAKLWGDIQKQQKQSLHREAGESADGQQLQDIARATKHEMEEAPEPPMGLTNAIMAKIDELKPIPWHVRLRQLRILVPSLAAFVMIIIIYSTIDVYEYSGQRSTDPESAVEALQARGRVIVYNDRRVTAAAHGLILSLEQALLPFLVLSSIMTGIISAIRRHFRISMVLLALAVFVAFGPPLLIALIMLLRQFALAN